MTCREAIDFLISYLDGELSPEICAEFERHLAICPSCVAYLDSYRQTVALCKSEISEEEKTGKRDLPDELVAAIQLALRDR